MNLLSKFFHITDLSDLAAKRGYCPRCEANRIFVKLNSTEFGIRCLSCRTSSVTLSLIDVIQYVISDLSAKSVYELSSRGTLVNYLEVASGKLTCSEFFDGVESGSYQQGVLCQDVQNLTFKAMAFDVCTSLEVFEHVPDDAKGFSEIHRVLASDGIFVFTVPINITINTMERARVDANGNIEHLTEPDYHGDTLQGGAPILAFRTYGLDIVDRLVAAGFERAEVRMSRPLTSWDHGRPVIVAYKSWTPNVQVEEDPLVVHYAEQDKQKRG